jgi:microcystin-dependent protein
MEGYIGEIRMFAGTFAPVGWLLCYGQALPISNYMALYSLLGTVYGGDGQITFGLPNLQSRVPIGPGQGPNLPLYQPGEMAGTEINVLSANTVGQHSHAIAGTAGILTSGEDGHEAVPANNYPAVNGDKIYATETNGVMAPAQINLTTGFTGSGAPLPVPNIQPCLATYYIICVEGIFPTPA